jgi:hypothetical protein
MDEGDWLAERFEAHRERLRAVAYRMPRGALDGQVPDPVAGDRDGGDPERLRRLDPAALER